MIEVEILPMTTDEDMMHSVEIPPVLFTPPDAPPQPSTSVNPKRLITFDSAEKETANIQRRCSQGQFLGGGGGSDRTSRTNTTVGSDYSKCPQGKRVLELYVADEELEASGNTKSALLIKKRRKDSVGGNRNKETSIANVLFDGDYSALHFQWSPMSSFLGKQEVFQPDNLPGARKPTVCCYEAFRQFWDDDILEHIVRETNRHGSQLSSSSSIVWVDTNKHEILIFFAFWMMLGIIQMPTINSCFSTHPFLKTSIFRKLLTKNRYWVLNRALCFVDNATHKSDSSKLFHLGPVVDHLNKKFSEAYTLGQDIVIDESLTLWKGSLSFKQRIKSKSIVDGIKTFELRESSTGYLWSFIIYTGKDSVASSSVLPKSMQVVLRLVRPLLNKGYRLFINNWYNSPLLARFLKRNNTDCVGTLRHTRKDIPDFIKQATLPEGSCVAQHSGDVVVMAYQDKRTVYTISTYHGTNYVPVNSNPGSVLRFKPAVIVDYKRYKDCAVNTDHMLESYLIERRNCQQWYKKMFKRLLNISILNSRIIVGNWTKNRKVELAFRLKLVENIIANHLDHTPMGQRFSLAKSYLTHAAQLQATGIFSDLPIARFVGSHFITRNPGNKDAPKTKGKSNSNGRVICFWCSSRYKRYKKTVWKCEQCNVPLCLEQCFKAYHTC